MMKTNEKWKKIPGFENYSVSDLGRVRNDTTGKMLSISSDKDGYQVCYCFNNGKRKTFRIHQLVAKAFIPNPNNYGTVDHITPDKKDNRVENLMWLSAEENSRKFQLEQITEEQKKVRSDNCKKMQEKAIESTSKPVMCIETGIVYSSICECSRKTGIYQSEISRVLQNKRNSAKGYHFILVEKEE